MILDESMEGKWGMGLKYFDELSWDEITREERFFCLQLYNHIKKSGIDEFIDILNQKRKSLLLPFDTNWEIGFEVCFYRDLWQHQGKVNDLYSSKRTFDLCLFSDDIIVIIEAKSHQGFTSKQLNSIVEDERVIKTLTNVTRVETVALFSSNYTPNEGTIPEAWIELHWDELSGVYGNDAVLMRANDIYGK